MIRYNPLLFIALSSLVTIGCGTVVEIENQSPKVDVSSLCLEDGLVYIDLVVTDVDEDPVDVALRLPNPGEIRGLTTNVDSPSILAAGPEGDGLVGLTSSATGRHHRIQWAQCPAGESVCTLGQETLALGGLNGCACVTSVDMFHVLQSLEVRASDRKSDSISQSFSDLEVFERCSSP